MTEQPTQPDTPAPQHSAPPTEQIEEPDVIVEAELDDAELGTEQDTKSSAPETDAESPSRRESFPVTGALDIDIELGSGQVAIALVDEPVASVEIRHDPGAENPWIQGISNLMDWVNNSFGNQRAATSDLAWTAVEESRITLDGRRLRVTGPGRRLRMVPLALTVRAPAGSRLNVRVGSADVTVTGSADRASVTTGSGTIALDRADGYAQLNTGSGDLRLGPMLGGLKARSGSGEVEISSVGGPTTVSTGSGDVWLGAVQSNVSVKTGSGDLTVADAAAGDIDLNTGSGEIRIGVRPGSAAAIDLSSGSGEARSELDVSDVPTANSPRLRIRGRTSSGNAVVTASVG